MLLGHPIDLKAKAGGEKSMSEKRGTLEDAEGVVLQDPRDKAKAKLPESQSPEDAMFHPPERRLKPVPPPALARHAGERTPGRRSDSQ